MKIAVRLILAGLTIALGIWLWFVVFPSPEKAVRKQLTKLATDVSFSADQNSLIKIANAESVSDFFTTNAEIIVNVPGYEEHRFSGRAEITQAALQSRQVLKSISLKFPDINVRVAPDKQSATADVTAELRINTKREHEPIIQELNISFEKMDGKWLIQKIETVQPVSILNFELPAVPFIMTG
ncbi:MAG TPA: hypothetical protein VFV23_07030 [Verrucomicrobiae bacterium]|nr:hypothetical protein [Verrucomicrobiae bacterium]